MVGGGLPVRVRLLMHLGPVRRMADALFVLHGNGHLPLRKHPERKGAPVPQDQHPPVEPLADRHPDAPESVPLALDLNLVLPAPVLEGQVPRPPTLEPSP